MDELLTPALEHVSGPHHGHYVAAYAVRDGEAFRAYAKIAALPIRDIWACNAFCKIGPDTAPTATAAVALVEERAVRIVASWR